MKISVIIPYDKDRGFLSEAVASAEVQTFKDYEIIQQLGNFNVSKNINDGLLKAKGEYIKILAEDDLLLPNCLQDLYDKIIEGYDWVCGDAINFGSSEAWYEDGKYREQKFTGCIPTIKEMLVRNQMHGGTTLYKKDMLFEVGGFDETLTTGEEYDLHLLLMTKGYKLGYVNKVVYRYWLHDYQKSTLMSVSEFHERKRNIKILMEDRYG